MRLEIYAAFPVIVEDNSGTFMKSQLNFQILYCRHTKTKDGRRLHVDQEVVIWPTRPEKSLHVYEAIHHATFWLDEEAGKYALEYGWMTTRKIPIKRSPARRQAAHDLLMKVKK